MTSSEQGEDDRLGKMDFEQIDEDEPCEEGYGDGHGQSVFLLIKAEQGDKQQQKDGQLDADKIHSRQKEQKHDEQEEGFSSEAQGTRYGAGGEGAGTDEAHDGGKRDKNDDEKTGEGKEQGASPPGSRAFYLNEPRREQHDGGTYHPEAEGSAVVRLQFHGTFFSVFIATPVRMSPEE